MPEFIVTDPTGKEHVVTAPDGATQDQALEYAKRTFATPQAKPNALLTRALPYLQGAIRGPLGLAVAGIGEGLKGLDKTAYGAGGAVTDVAAKVLPPEGAAALGLATNVGVQAIPTILGGMAAKAASPALESGATSLMQSALKPSIKSLKDGSAAKAITTMLDEGINVSGGGVAKLRGQIGKLNEQIVTAIANSPATIDKNKAASALLGTVQKFSKQVNPEADVKAIQSAWSEFLNHPLIKGDQIPVQLAQELKQGTYKVLAGKYGEMGSAATEAQKTLARGLKEGIADAVPGISGLNATESALINALQLTEKRALMEGNKNLGGIAWLSHNPVTWAAFMADKSSLFKSIVARMMHSGAERIPETAGRLGVAGYEAGTNAGSQP